MEILKKNSLVILQLKNKSHKIKGFTLSEMIVTIIITIIVVALAFSVLSLVQKQMNGISNNLEKDTKVNLLRQALWTDFKKHQYISVDIESHEINFKNELGEIKYKFAKDNIIRQRDTFNVVFKKYSFFYDGEQQSSGVIDAIELIVGTGEEKIFVHKKNTADQYLN